MARYYFVGIKGAGMSPLAQILHDLGNEVKGSDVAKHFFTEKGLLDRKIEILVFSEENIKNLENDWIIIMGNAFVKEGISVEADYIRNTGRSYYQYNDFLGQFMEQFTSIGISGTHGKTSTTGLLSHVMNKQRKTTKLVGDGTGQGIPDSEFFALESCEYRGHFKAYHPDYAIITNIDYDHPDSFKNIQEVIDVFQSFANNVKKGIVLCGDDPNCHKIKADVPLVTYGFNVGNDFYVPKDSVVKLAKKGTQFDVYYQGQFYGQYWIPLYGAHSIQNALSVIAICELEGLDKEITKEAFHDYKGVKRRFSEKDYGFQILIDDYAHHHNEVLATLDATTSKYPGKPVIAIFQPHTISRTKQFLSEFAVTLSKADKVYLCDIFKSAREEKAVPEVVIEDLQKLIQDSSIITKDSVEQLLQHQNAVLLFMGAGDIPHIQNAYEQLLASQNIHEIKK